ncbi:MAG: hypothetical protein J0M24_13910 [Verrucomicrobia bacterium]|nr:hypothetical protein [Verrucomicrobiota bacterium]
MNEPRTLPSERPEMPLQPLNGPRTDAWRIRHVSESAWHHLEDIRHRARQHAGADPEWALILREINLAQSHLAIVRRLADEKRKAIGLRAEA